MKLKKAMRLYPILYKIGERRIWFNVTQNTWKGLVDENAASEGEIKFATEKEAVAWLIEGATKLSPIQIAMRKHKEIVGYKHPLRNTIWKFHGRSIHKDNFNINYPWVAEAEHFRSSFATEKEAVRWLLTDPEDVKHPNVALKTEFSGKGITDNKPFSTVSFLEKKGRLPIIERFLASDKMMHEWHKCPICGKYHRL